MTGTNKKVAARITFLAVFFGACLVVKPQDIELSLTSDKVVFLEGQDSVLVYQAGATSREGSYARANYIHPLFGLEGDVLTEDFPDDHLHHRGIFWAWHQLYVGDQRIGDAWEIKDFSWRVLAMDTLSHKSSGKTLKTNVVWESPKYTNAQGAPQPLVKELTMITVHPLRKGVRAIDISIALQAKMPQMTIGGSEDEKGYGGFSARIVLPGDVAFSNERGAVQPTNIPVDPSAWMQLTGSLSPKRKFGFTIIPHGKNPGHPNPWILRKQASMQNAVYPYPGKIPVPLSMERPTVLRYRMLVHGDGLPNEVLQQFRDDFLGRE